MNDTGKNLDNPDMNNANQNSTDLERRLREALHREAEQITPHERRTEIVAMAHDETQTARTPRRWLIPAAAAASVALIGAAIWGVSNTGGSQQAGPALSTASAPTATGAPTTSPTTGPAPTTAAVPLPSQSPAATSNGAGASTLATLPAYFVGANSASRTTFGLYREFVTTSVPAGASTAQKARAAVAAAMAMNAPQLPTGEPYLQPWAGTSVNNVTVTPSRITVALSGPGASGLTAAQSKLAVQELVWTAQAAVGQGNIPVKFTVADGSAKLFGLYPTAQTYNRPPAALQYEVLAPIWITSPARNQVLPGSRPVVAAGQSCAFEATTAWQLSKGGTKVRSGTTTASSGCPTRGTWVVRLGVLAPGAYTFRMYEVGMKDGTVIADTSRAFSVK